MYKAPSQRREEASPRSYRIKWSLPIGFGSGDGAREGLEAARSEAAQASATLEMLFVLCALSERNALLPYLNGTMKEHVQLKLLHLSGCTSFRQLCRVSRNYGAPD